MSAIQYAAIVMDGVIHIHGPFTDAAEAQTWADANLSGEYWVQKINPVEPIINKPINNAGDNVARRMQEEGDKYGHD